MTTRVLVTLDQLQRPHPGGIGTYVRGLLAGLDELASSGEFPGTVEGLACRESSPELSVPCPVTRTRLSTRVATVAWRHWPIGVPASADVVHATSLAGPFRGGASAAVHSVSLHDVLWRDHPELTTRRGAAFHEQRLRQILETPRLRVLVSSTTLRARLVSEGLDPARAFSVRLGVHHRDQSSLVDPREIFERRLAERERPGETFTLVIGTIQPRKNLERLIAAHARARTHAPELGPLVLVGARGWGSVDTTGAVELGELSDIERDSLLAGCRVCVCVPIEEGWGLPAVEGLVAGRPVVASATLPSTQGNTDVVAVDPLSIDDITDGLLRALAQRDDDDTRERRRASVADLTWANCARDHLAAWS